MRRNDREVCDMGQIYKIISQCHCCRIGFIDAGNVYIVPLNFGEVVTDEGLILYFHSAKEGRKIELIKEKASVGFEMDTNYEIKPADIACNFSAKYQSVIGEGTAEIVDNYDEKIMGLQAIMKHSTGKEWDFKMEMIEVVCVFKVKVQKISCKQIVK